MGSVGSNTNIGGLTKQSLSNTAGYTDSTSARVINQALRNDITSTIRDYQDIINRLDSNMEATTKDMTVYREMDIGAVITATGAQPAANTFEALKEALVGKTFTDKGYYSSYYEKTDNQYDNSVLETYVPKGTNAILTSNDKEKEVILSRNGTYQVNDIQLVNGQFRLKVERVK